MVIVLTLGSSLTVPEPPTIGVVFGGERGFFVEENDVCVKNNNRNHTISFEEAEDKTMCDFIRPIHKKLIKKLNKKER